MIAEHPAVTKEEEFLETESEFEMARLRAAIEEAQAEIREGKFVTFEEIKKEFSSWVTK